MQNNFLTNTTPETFLDRIKADLTTCKSFEFSVSFIKLSGLGLMLDDMKKALDRGAMGRVITSTYQNFTDIESLRRFKRLKDDYKNFDCRLDFESFLTQNGQPRGYHSKGYVFDFEDRSEVIIGSSNITRFALIRNIEWDVVVCESHTDSPVYDEARAEFEKMWQKTFALDEKIISDYAAHLNYAIERWDMDYDDFSRAKIKPNYMQRRALKELSRIRQMGVDRAMVVSAAGSGKTYLAAFDALNFDPRKLLYIVHEGSILDKSLRSFQDVFGGCVTYGKFTGGRKDYDCDLLFATNISICNSLETFRKDEFDYIIVDECHHAPAGTYTKIINYFTPEFLLGLTATPERMDDKDVLDLFGRNVPLDFRLGDSIRNGLVVPFRYFGIRDDKIDYGAGTDRKSLRKFDTDFSNVEHCRFIRDEIESHRPAGKLKAIAFCRSIDQARWLSENMSKFYHTAYLTGRNPIGERIYAYNELQSDDGNKTEILFSVDILNEGVDIPAVNMVLFLRPTDSSTVFIQQLGRGLRKYEGKEYVTVLDLIGNNYRRSVQIAFALCSIGQNITYDRPTITDLIRHNFEPLGLGEYGVKISIDEKSQSEILENLESVNLNSRVYLEQEYRNFKNFISAETYPKHMDYLNNDCAPDMLRFINAKTNNRKNCSYYAFLKSIDEEGLPSFTEEETDFINELSSYLPLVRKHEYLLVKGVLEGICGESALREYLMKSIPDFRDEQMEHAVKYFRCLKKVDGEYALTAGSSPEFTDYVKDLIDYGLGRYGSEYEDETDFKVGLTYRIEQVNLKLLQTPGDVMRGTHYVENHVVIFASLHKDESVKDRLKYEDRFISPKVFQWESMAGVSLRDRQRLNTCDFAYLFIRKVGTEFGQVLPFTYVGKGKLTNPRERKKAGVGRNGKEKDDSTVLYDIELEKELPEYLQFDFGLAE